MREVSAATGNGLDTRRDAASKPPAASALIVWDGMGKSQPSLRLASTRVNDIGLTPGRPKGLAVKPQAQPETSKQITERNVIFYPF
mmetsp:Transcript_18238/g.34837  ORF Transcript_18238/g.34837 Transcript_18238/m.34837 type:complete len:86 (-) Transcript_18238:119-376(-)